MIDYSKGKIYTIRFFDNDKLIYIGSTTQSLAIRFGNHKRAINFSSLNKYIQDNYENNYQCCYIELLEYFICNNKEELDKKEGEIIRKFKEDDNYIVINKRIAGRKHKEWLEDNKEKIIKYYKDNEDKYKKYREKNKDKRREYIKQNKEKINEKRREYYQRKKQEKLNIITTDFSIITNFDKINLET
jgi:hypothetical protein